MRYIEQNIKNINQILIVFLNEKYYIGELNAQQMSCTNIAV